jgi:hypothetical protein
MINMMAAGPATTLIEMQPLGQQQQQPTTGATSNKSSPARSQRRARPTDLASFDSSDTWASCNPFPSITDLAGWSPQSGTGPAERDTSELYVKPLEMGKQQQQQQQQHYGTVDETSSLLYQQINEQPDDDSPVKQPSSSNKPRPRFKEAFSSDDEDSSSCYRSPAKIPMVSSSTSSSKNKETSAGKSGGGGGLVSSVNKKFRQKSTSSGGSSGGKPSFLTGKGIASATRFLNYRFHSLQSAGKETKFIFFHPHLSGIEIFLWGKTFPDNRGRASPDRKKSILKRSSDTTGGGGGGSTSVGSTSAGALSDHTDTEMEKLIGGGGMDERGGATASESGSEPFSPVVAQRSSRARMTDGLLGGNKTGRKPSRPSGTPDSIGGHISINMGGGTNMTTSCALEDWPFADYSPTDEAITSASAGGGHPSAT